MCAYSSCYAIHIATGCREDNLATRILLYYPLCPVSTAMVERGTFEETVEIKPQCETSIVILSTYNGGKCPRQISLHNFSTCIVKTRTQLTDLTATFARKSVLRLCGRKDFAANQDVYQTLHYLLSRLHTFLESVDCVVGRRPVSRENSSLVKKNATVSTSWLG